MISFQRFACPRFAAHKHVLLSSQVLAGSENETVKLWSLRSRGSRAVTIRADNVCASVRSYVGEVLVAVEYALFPAVIACNNNRLVICYKSVPYSSLSRIIPFCGPAIRFAPISRATDLPGVQTPLPRLPTFPTP